MATVADKARTTQTTKMCATNAYMQGNLVFGRGFIILASVVDPHIDAETVPIAGQALDSAYPVVDQVAFWIPRAPTETQRVWP